MADIELSVGLQKGSVNTSQIKSELEGLLKGLAGSKATKINIEPVISSDAFKSFQTQLTSSLNSISQSATETASSLRQVSQVIQEINSKNFNINLQMDNTSAISDQIDRYKAQVSDFARSYKSALNEIVKLGNTGAFASRIQGGRSAGPLASFHDQYSEILRQAYDYEAQIEKLNNRMSSVKSLTGANAIAKEFAQYWNSVTPILEKANSLGLSNFDLTKFKFPDLPKDIAETATQMTGIFDQMAPGFKQSVEEMKSMLQSAVEEINASLSNIGKGASTDGMKQAAEAVKSATESAASSINAEKQALDQVVPAKSQVAAKEAEVASQSGQVAAAAVAAAEGIKVENDALDDQSRLYKRRVTYFDENGNPLSRTTRYPGSSLGGAFGNDTVTREAYRNGSWETLDTSEIHNRAQQYSNAVAIWKRAELDRLQVLDQITRLQAQINQNGDPNGLLRNQIDALIGIRPGANGARSLNELNNLIPTLQAEMHLFDDLEANTNAYAKALDELGARRQKYSTQWAANTKNPDPLLGNTSKEYYTQLARIVDLQNQVVSAQKNWSAAANGKSASSYSGLSQLASDLNTLSTGLSGMTKSGAEQEIARISARFRELGLEIASVGENHRSFFAQMTDFKSIFASILTPMRIYMAIGRVIKQATKNAIELQDAFVDLQIVTGKSGKEFSSYTKTATSSAQELGVATKDLITATTSYARLGYSLDESSILSKYTAMLEKVGNIGAEDAQNAVTALLKAFPDDIDIGNIESVMDKLVTVGNKFPISVSQIAEGMNNASSALAAAGNSFEESVALLTAANATIQNASRSSTGLRTIAARLTNTTADLEELGETDFTKSKYEDLVAALTDYHVALTDVNGEYRSTYDIMADLAAIWDTLDSKSRAALATAIAGTRQQAVFYSLIGNFQESAVGAMGAMASSDGAMEKAYDIYLQSITAHINQFKAAFDGLAQGIIGPLTPIINAIIDIGSAIINLVSIVMTALGPAIEFIGNILSTVTSGIGTLIKNISDIASRTPAATAAITALGLALATLGVFFKTFSLTGPSPLTIVLGIASILSAISAVVSSMNGDSLGSLVEQANEAQEQLDELNHRAEETKNRIDELRSIKGTSEWSLSMEKELASLTSENALIQTQIKLQEDLLAAKNKEKRNQARRVANKAAPEGPMYWGATLTDTARAYVGMMKSGTSSEEIESSAEALWDYIEKVTEARDALDPQKDADYIQRIDAALAETYKLLEISVDSTSEAAQGALTGTSVPLEALNDIVERTKTNFSNLSSAINESFSSTGMSADSVMQVRSAFASLDGFDPSALFEMTGAGIKMNSEELARLTAQYVELEKQNLYKTIDVTGKKLKSVDKQLQELNSNAEDYEATKERLESDKKAFENDILNAQAAIVEITALTNAYNEYIAAKSRAENTDKLSTIKSDYETIADYFKRGMGNARVVTEYLEMFFGNGMVADNQQAWELLNATIASTGHTLMDYMTVNDSGKLTRSGLDLFVKDLWEMQKAGVFGDDNIISKMQDGSFDINMRDGKIETVAKAFGTSTEFIRNFLEAMQDVTGANIDLEEIFGPSATESGEQGGVEDPLEKAADYIHTIEAGANGEVTVTVPGDTFTDLDKVIEKLDRIAQGAHFQIDDNGSVSAQFNNVNDLVDFLNTGVPPETPVTFTDNDTGQIIKTTAGQIADAIGYIKPETPVRFTQQNGEEVITTAGEIRRGLYDIPDNTPIVYTDNNGEEVLATAGEIKRGVVELEHDHPIGISIDKNGNVRTTLSNIKTDVQETSQPRPINFTVDDGGIIGKIESIGAAADAAAGNGEAREIKYKVTFGDGSEGEFTEGEFKDLINQDELGKAVAEAAQKAAEEAEKVFEENGFGPTPLMAAMWAQHETEQGWDYDKDFTVQRRLEELGKGGNVDLLNRPLIDANQLVNAGWVEAAEGAATVFTSTFSNAAGNVAMNFTPIIVDGNGQVEGIMSPENLQTYAENVINGVHPDYFNLQIGAQFTGESAIDDAVAAAEEIHELQEEFYLDNQEVTVPISFEINADRKNISAIQNQIEEYAEDAGEDAHAEIKVDGINEASQGANSLYQILTSMPGVTNVRFEDNALVAEGEVGALSQAIAAVPSEKTITFNIVTNGSIPDVSGGTAVQGSAIGTKNARGGLTLVNELGPEFISDNGTAYIANGGKPALVNLSKGAIVLTADETREALGYHGRGRTIKAYASGTALINDLKTTSAVRKIDQLLSIINSPGSSSKKDPGGGGTYTPGDGNGNGNGNGNGGNGGNGGGSSNDDKKEKIDWIEVAIDRVERAIDALAKTVSSAFKMLTTRLKASSDEIAKIQEEISLAEQGAERYFKEAESVKLKDELKEKARNGTIDINEYNKDTAEKINEYLKWYEKGLDLQQKVAELHENIAEIYQDRFNMVQDDYEKQLEQLEHEIEMQEKNVDMVSARGYLENASFYAKMAEIESGRLSKMRSEMADLQRYFNEAMASGEIEEGSEAWYEMLSSINDVKEAIADANIQLVEYQKTMRSIAWDTFDYVLDRFDQLTDESNFLIDLISNSDLYDERGQFNNAGLATLGMRSLNYNAFMQQADEYAKELESINQLISDDPYDTELIERREELLSLQRDAISAAENEKEAVKSLVEEGINKELDALKELIDEYKESLDSAKDLYDYQNKLSEKAESIANIQKQLAAYAGDTSEENRARVQKLQKDLASAQKDLRDTEYERSISDQKKMLDELYDEYEDLLNARLDDINKLMQDMIDTTNEHMSDIREKVDEITTAVGYGITDEMSTALNGVFSYYDQMFTGVTSISTVLDGIYNMVGAMAQASGAVRAYSSGGIVDYTGLAMLHGSPGAPEMVLNPTDTARFLQMVSAMHSIYDFGDSSSRNIALRDTAGLTGGTNIGSINLGIEIDHVQDYNDFVTQLRDDPKFEKLVQAMTIEPALGKSMFSKNRINF